MLVFKNLTKKYGNITAVDNLNLEIEKGEFFGLLGPNGAGKTTTIRMLSTLTAPTSGSISIDGRSMDRNLSEVKVKIGVVPQHTNLEGEMTAWQNLELHGCLYRMPKDARRKRIDELLEFTELSGRANDLVKNFSGGMKRKLMIARALMHKPDILLMDEPTVGLDAAARRKMWDLMKSLNKNGLTVLLTTHYIEEAEILCNRVGLMNEGRLIELDTPKKLVEKVGRFVAECFENGETSSSFFDTRQEAVSYASQIQGSVNIRPSNLEDVFIKLTNRRVGA
ncbi:ABC transporter ATP-binding protein [Petroclostridium xylanilyticum]|uniref:ABC transporter ATP-binding protein n=1 Tax=Petroclostridium xylanilyticum TaxID=1792311 RepID=UPI000B985ED8|nr:ABC transporter ATP-binding protein [Petroclostridium xylanilyticum]